MPTALSWGILGTGNIARQFCAGVRTSSRCRLAAVASRSPDSARAFAQSFDIPAPHSSYESLLHDPTVQAIYISLPNSLHHEWTLKSLRAGKHVLCEKPFATNLPQAKEMFSVAEKTGCTLVEAFMYRSHPLTHAVVNAVRSGAIGRLKLIRTSFCYRTSKIAGNIRFSQPLAGGALMDIGCYCLSLSRLLAGEEPATAHAVGHLCETGVDDYAAGVLQFPSGVTASFTCGMTVQADNTAYLCGDEGYLEIPIPWKPPIQQAAYTITTAIPPRQDQPPLTSTGRPPPPGSSPRHTPYVDAPCDL